MKIKIDDLASVIAKELQSYSQDITDGIKESVREVAKEAKAEIQRNAPTRTGKYKKGWQVKTVFENTNDIRLVVHNKNKPQLTHLLEKPHVISNGTKRVFGMTKGQPHIAQAEENAVEKLMNKAKVVIKG